MTWLEASILGLVQGATEFLPVSSSAHLILFPWFLGWPEHGLAFDAFLHLGTILAVLVYFFSDWVRLLRAGLSSIWERRIGFDHDRLQFWMILVGTVPGGLAGLWFHEYAESVFRTPLLIAIPLSLVGFLLYWVDGRFTATRSMEDLRFRDAIWVGIAQAFAIIPGVSRSGATMTMARFLGMNREAAARFSFLLSFPIILAAGLFKGKDLILGAAGVDASGGVLAAGLFCATVSGLICIHLLLSLLRSADFAVFAWYRMGLAALIIVWSLTTGR